jgi:predicted kinase
MEAILLIGLQGAGKSSFYKKRYFGTHVRISLDLLRTRHRQQLFLDACLTSQQRFVVDNTNLTFKERSKYIALALAASYSIVGYYFESKIEQCLSRNAGRTEAEQVPAEAIYSSAKKLELPTRDEGFHELFYVRLQDKQFVVEEWRDEV